MATISVPCPKWDVDTIKSRDVNVKASAGTIEAVAGHLLYKQNDGSYKAYPVATVIDDEGIVGVLAEDASLTTTAKSLRVIEAGVVYIEAARAAGIVAAKVSDEAMRGYSTNRSAIVFTDYKKETSYYGV